MPDWTAPFTVPKMTTPEYLRMKAKYVAKYGYTIDIPGFSDIIHLHKYREVTAAEQKEWRKTGHGDLSPERIVELTYVKKQNKEKFLSMLASPTPDVFMNHASMMTSIDDSQDALATLVMIGKVAAKSLPRSIAGVLEGPVGWMLLGSDMLNLVMETQRPYRIPRANKRVKDSCTELNPFSKKARAARALKIKRGLPTKGDIIQALQTTDQVFGYGVSLGALMNLPISIIAGNVRRFIYGERVSVKYPVPDISFWGKLCEKFMTNTAILWGLPMSTDDVDITAQLIGYNCAHQIRRTERVWNPLDHIPDIHTLEIKAPSPTNQMTLEMYEEEGLDPEDFVGWPGLNKKWATIEEIHTAIYPTAVDNFRRYCHRNKSNFMGMIGAQNAVEGSLYMLENIEGRGSVIYDYTAPCKAIHKLQVRGYHLPLDVPRSTWKRFLAWLDEYEAQGDCPTLKQILDYSLHALHIRFTLKRPYVRTPLQNILAAAPILAAALPIDHLEPAPESP